MAETPTVQHWNPVTYVRDASFVARLGEPLIELLAPRADQRILDLGCGEGALTERLGACGATVVGVDASLPLVTAARARGLDARVVDGESLTFDCEFDAVFSNAALHWMTRPERVIAGVRRALRPHGRFVGEFGGAGNTATIQRALIDALERRGIAAAERSPWYFPTVATYRAALEAGGFELEQISSFERPTPLPGDVLAWLTLFTESFTSALPEHERLPYLQEVRTAIAPTLRDASGGWTVDYVRLRFAARRV